MMSSVSSWWCSLSQGEESHREAFYQCLSLIRFSISVLSVLQQSPASCWPWGVQSQLQLLDWQMLTTSQMLAHWGQWALLHPQALLEGLLRHLLGLCVSRLVWQDGGLQLDPKFMLPQENDIDGEGNRKILALQGKTMLACPLQSRWARL